MDNVERGSSPSQILALYGQVAPGTAAFVVGTAEGLRALRDVIDRSLAGDESPVQIAFVTDPSGNRNGVVVAALAPDVMTTLASPATDPAFRGPGVRPDAVPDIVGYMVDHQRRVSATREAVSGRR